MLKRKEYKSIDYLFVALKIVPLQSVLLIVYMIINALMPAAQALALANFVDHSMKMLEGGGSLEPIIISILLIMLCILFVNLMPSIMDIVNLSAKNKMTLVLKNEILNKKSFIECQYAENAETQELIHRVTEHAVENFIGGFQNILAAANIIISIVSLLMIIMASTVTGALIIVAVCIPLLALAVKTGEKNYVMSKEAKKIQRKYNYQKEVLMDKKYANERILFGYGQKLIDNYVDLYHQAYKIESKIEWKTYANMKSGSIVTLIIAAIIVAILIPAIEDTMSVGVFIALVTAILNLVQNMSWNLSNVMKEYSRLKEYLKDFNRFLRLNEKENAAAEKEKTAEAEIRSVEFRNVSFQYPGTDKYVLKNCSFVLEGNKSYAFVGNNGAGKSTIIKLLIGQYDNYDGEILINNINIRDYNFGLMKAFISVVFQDFQKFSVSLKDNIIIGDSLLYDENRLNEVISAVGLNDLVNRLPKGINTNLGKIIEDGIDLSEGQWQKVAIARLLYANAKINILDEPTASLDPMAECNIYELFSRINRNRFTIYITHRLSAAKIADEILVISDGSVAEKGSHAQLMGIHNGLYQKMFESQKSWYEYSDKVS